jgi:hypothetical protein
VSPKSRHQKKKKKKRKSNKIIEKSSRKTFLGAFLQLRLCQYRDNHLISESEEGSHTYSLRGDDFQIWSKTEKKQKKRKNDKGEKRPLY